jgi:hypothetical protein
VVISAENSFIKSTDAGDKGSTVNPGAGPNESNAAVFRGNPLKDDSRDRGNSGESEVDVDVCYKVLDAYL